MNKKIPIIGIHISGELMEAINTYTEEHNISLCEFFEKAANEFLIKENC